MPPTATRQGVAGQGDGPMIGRDVALAQAVGWLDDVRAGKPRLIRLEGNPGAGKTTLLGALVDRFSTSGGKVTTTSCVPADATPRDPIHDIEVALEPGSSGAAQSAYGPSPAGTADTQVLVAEVGRVLPLLLDAAATQPLLVAIEDVHWAGPVTRSVIETLIDSIAGSAAHGQVAVALVLTSRPILDGNAAAWWKRLGDASAARTLALEGLGPLEITELFLTVFDRPPEARLLAAIERATAGNPLHLLALFARLRRDALVTESAGRWVLAGSDVLPLERPLTGEIDSMLERLGADERSMLDRLSVFGESADVASLVPPGDPGAASAMLSTLVDLGPVQRRGGRIAFAHSSVRDAVYQGLDDRSRARLHAQAAFSLAWCDSAGSDQTEVSIAHHLHLAGHEADAELVKQHAETAAESCDRRGAWTDASRFWRMAVEVAEPADRARLHLRAGVAAYNDLDAATARAQLRPAIAEARAHGELRLWGEALEHLLRTDLVLEPESMHKEWDDHDARAFLGAAGTRFPELRARILDVLASIAFNEHDSGRGEELAEEGLAILEGTYGTPTEGLLRFSLGLHSLGRLDLSEAEHQYRLARPNLENAPQRYLAGWVPGRLAMIEVLRGRARESERIATEAMRVNRAACSWAEFSIDASLLCGTAVAKGDWAGAERLGATADNAYQRSNFYVTPAVLYPALAAARALRGDARGGHRALDEMDRSGARGAWRHRLIVDWLCGDKETVRRALYTRLPSAPKSVSLLTLSGLAAHAELAVAVGDARMASTTKRALEEVHRKGVRVTTGWPSSIGRLLASISLLEDDLDAAGVWIADAERTADRLQSPVERSLVMLEQAKLAIRKDRPGTARDTLETCVLEFDRLGMLPFRSTAIEVLATLDVAVSRPSAVQRFIMFTDLCSSTSLNRQIGDEQFLEVVAEHNRIVRRRLEQYGGVEVKQTGDGILAWFSDADRALRCALHAVTDMERLNVMHPDRPIHVRAGLSVGRPLPMDGDLYGLSVNEAARICDAAEPGRLLVGEGVVEAAQDPPPHHPAGAFDLKGLDPGQRLVEIDTI